MKNKKIISLTIFAVVLVAVGILGLSKLFENGWQNVEQIDNKLDVEIIDSVENVFDYKYVTFENMECLEKVNWFVDDKYKTDCFFREQILPLPDGAISYQDAANIAGNAITYTTGETSHQKNTAYLNIVPQFIGKAYNANKELIHFNIVGYDDIDSLAQMDIFYYQSFNETIPQEEKTVSDIEFSVGIDVYTGEIYYLLCYYNYELLKENEGFIYDSPVKYYKDVDSITEKELLSTALEIAKICGNKEEFDKYLVLEYKEYYRVFIQSSLGNIKSVCFLKESNNYKFCYYGNTTVGTSPYDFTFKEILK